MSFVRHSPVPLEYECPRRPRGPSGSPLPVLSANYIAGSAGQEISSDFRSFFPSPRESGGAGLGEHGVSHPGCPLRGMTKKSPGTERRIRKLTGVLVRGGVQAILQPS